MRCSTIISSIINLLKNTSSVSFENTILIKESSISAGEGPWKASMMKSHDRQVLSGLALLTRS